MAPCSPSSSIRTNFIAAHAAVNTTKTAVLALTGKEEAGTRIRALQDCTAAIVCLLFLAFAFTNSFTSP